MEPLTQILDHQREVILAKVSGLDQQQLNARLAPSTMTLGGLLSHLANVEDWWLNRVFAGQPASPPWRGAPWDQDRDWDWHRAETLPPAQLLTEYTQAVTRSRDILGPDPDLEQVVTRHVHGRDQQFTLHWILLHLIQEYARHCGHADLLRESIDGSTG